MSTEKKWPSHFPVNCPPVDAIAGEIEVYRLVDSDPPNKKDFLSYYELGRKYNNLMLACGLSCYSDHKHAVEQANLLVNSPYYKKKKFSKKIAKGKTQPSCGVYKRTPSQFPSHITYWLYDGVSIEQQFNVM